MTASERPPQSLSALSDKEREILFLLAAGHTVKSIAANLGRTEASINERLRDARRKTGVGSSRELARLLDTRKIWDKNIDLSTESSTANNPGQPQSAGRPWSKGMLVMLLTLPAAVIGLLVTTTNPMQPAASTQTVQAAAPKQLPLVGSWSLNVGRMPAEEHPRRVTIEFHVSKDQKWTTVVEIVGPDGSISHAESTAALDGVPAPITGDMDFIDSVSLRQPAPNTLVMTLGKNGAPVSTRVYTVSKDQKSMTETIVWAGDGIPKLETTYFDRVD